MLGGVGQLNPALFVMRAIKVAVVILKVGIERTIALLDITPSTEHGPKRSAGGHVWCRLMRSRWPLGTKSVEMMACAISGSARCLTRYRIVTSVDAICLRPNRHNQINIPPQGLAMLRLYPLEPWHAGHGYSALESPADRELKG